MFIDSHCHLDLACFHEDLDAVLARAASQDVSRFLVPGIDAAHWPIQQGIAARHSHVDIAYGYHPFFLPTPSAPIQDSDIDQMMASLLAQIQQTPRCRAVGEIGIDRTLSTPLAWQEAVFVAQVKVAKQCALPLIMHHRKSHDRLLGLLKQQHFVHGGIIHAFHGSIEVAEAYIALGFKLGVGGTITYPRGHKTLAVLKQVGLAHLVLETDSPDMPLHGRQGQRNEPKYLPQVATVLATAFAVDIATIGAQTSANYAAVLWPDDEHANNTNA
jgi:TatD DNase family protein